MSDHNNPGLRTETSHPARRDWHVTLSHAMYLAHLVGLAIGAFSSAATMIGALVVSWFSVLAVLLNYFFRGDVDGTWLQSHFAWQRSTFWRCFVALIIAYGLYLIVVGFILNVVFFPLVGLWATWRLRRGWSKLFGGEAIDA